MKDLTNKEKELIKKYESGRKIESFEKKKEMYIKQTDKNYKDGDKN